MTMLAVGRGLRDLAHRGMSAVSKAETVENQQRLALETAKQQQESATLGTGAGIGGLIGANKMMDASKAANAGIDGINAALDGYGTASRSFTGGLEYTPVGKGTLTGDAAVSTMKNTALGIDGLATPAAPVEGVLANATPAVVEGGTLLTEATPAVGEALTTVEGGIVAAEGGGFMANLSTMATPIAIGLGVAFLLNKLFD